MTSSVLTWNRLEPQAQSNDLSVALRCEIRDALWMFARQWQMGEFRAEDAGTCAFVKVEAQSAFAQKLSLRGAEPRPCSPETPLNFLSETVAPLENHSPAEGVAPVLSLDLRMEWGRYWLRLLKAKLPAAKAPVIIKQFKANPLLHFRPPAAHTPDEEIMQASALANPAYVQMLSALSTGRALDGWELFQQLQTRPASNFLPQPDSAVDQLGLEFKKWVAETFPALTAAAGSAWNASRLEYQFDCAAPNGTSTPTILRVAEHDGSQQDWHTFEHGSDGPTPVHPGLQQSISGVDPIRRSATLLPRAVSFPGAPSNRWWEMEDSTIDLSNLRPSATDPAHLVLAEFALLFSNDWLSFPLDLPNGSLTQISGMLVTDVFGSVTRIQPALQNANWGLFSIAANSASGLWLPPVATSIAQSPVKTEVLLLRDELANLAWGIENIIPDGLGGGRDGLEAANALRLWLERLTGTGNAPSAAEQSSFADKQYVLGTSVPENWIPFVPIRFDKNGQMRLRRAALPRTLTGRAPERIRPRTTILRDGLDSAPVQPFDVNEEEITMPGILIRECWRQARWFDGRIFTWLAREKTYARPARASGLRFDTAGGTGPSK
jgi:hypothetical protein